MRVAAGAAIGARQRGDAGGDRQRKAAHGGVASVGAGLHASAETGTAATLRAAEQSPPRPGLAPGTEPDLALVRARPDAYFLAHPTAACTALVIEVADRSLAFDLDTKLRLYSDAGIPNYWVVDVPRPAVIYLLQQRHPDPLLEALRDAVERILEDLRGR